jgi:1-acyl-sn-glycerol-3-phosphate acyltransferase
MGKFSEILLFGVSNPIVKTYTGAMLDWMSIEITFPAGAKITAPNHPSTTDPFFVAEHHPIINLSS